MPLCLAVPHRPIDNPQRIVDAFRKEHGNQTFENCLVKGYVPEPDEDCSGLIREVVTDIDRLFQGEVTEE